MVNDPLSPSGPPRIPDPPYEACSENILDTSKLKEVNDCLSSVTGMKSPGNPAILYRAMSSEASQLGAECAPDSVDLRLDLHLTADSPMSEFENSVNSVDATSAPDIGIARTASCPAMMQLCIQQTGLIPVLSVGYNTPNSCLPIGPSYAEILCCGIDADPPGFLVGGESCWPISEEDRIAALGLVGAPLPPVLERASGLVSYPPGGSGLQIFDSGVDGSAAWEVAELLVSGNFILTVVVNQMPL
ncbi:hypothetical protein Nepgr_017439 [Nepenthes gracilis]|uniref:Uncharacterized protein n=1 Tax=Nepenthes gracilis TaxID=150966 RepID=A0AAD3XSH1_NEPGR|nr:hypothetical protein Nepgr_017439 [Nepenthes gracilis]